MLELIRPTMLWGVALVALPVLAHVLYRHAPQRLRFPAVRWLIESAANQRSWLKLRRPFLLLLRCLIVALIASAFARPEWQARAHGTSDPHAGTSVVLVLDTSLSTRQTGHGVQAFELLKAGALRSLARLSTGTDRVQLVIARRWPRAVFDDFTLQHAVVAHEIRSLADSAERAELTVALALAGKQLEKREGPRKVVIVSDLQRTSWLGLAARADLQRALPGGTQLTVEPFELAPIANLALARPSVHPPRPFLGQKARLGTLVQNHSERSQSVEVQLAIDGAHVASRRVELAAHSQAQVAFEATFSAATASAIQFSIPNDGLVDDDAAYLIVRPIAALPVLITGSTDQDSPGSAAYYVSRALAPQPARNAAFALRHVALERLDAADLERSSVVVIADAPQLSAASLTLFEQFLKRGGNLLYFSGHAAAKANLTALGQRLGAGTLPFELGSLRSTSEDAALRMQHADAQSPIFGEYSPPELAALGDFRLTRAWTTPSIAATAHKLIEYGDGSIAAALAQAGRGRLLLCNFSPADVGSHGAFVALLQSMVAALPAQGQSFDAYTLGDVVQRAVPELARSGGSTPSVIGPDAARLAQASFTLRNRSVDLQLERAALPGIYRVLDGTKPVDAFAINVDERESDLARSTPPTASEAHSRLTAATDAAAESEPGRPLWGWLVLSALLLLAAEAVLVAQLGRGAVR